MQDELRNLAVDETWARLQENLDYVEECRTEEEALDFAKQTFVMPEDVIEMAEVNKGNDDHIPSHHPSPSSAVQLAQETLSLSNLNLEELNAVSLDAYNDDNFTYTATVLDKEQLDFMMLGQSKPQLPNIPNLPVFHLPEGELLSLSGVVTFDQSLQSDSQVFVDTSKVEESPSSEILSPNSETNSAKRKRREAGLPARFKDFAIPVSSAGTPSFKS